MASDFLTINPQAAGALARKGSAVIVTRVTKRTAMIAAGRAPGTMRQKIRPIITGGANPLGIVMVDHPAASFVLHGTKPHDIRPVKGKTLKFEIGGRCTPGSSTTPGRRPTTSSGRRWSPPRCDASPYDGWELRHYPLVLIKL